MRLVRLTAALLLLAPTLHSQSLDTPGLSGRITRITSPNDFDVDGNHVLFTPKTVMRLMNETPFDPPSHPTPHLGEPIEIFGKFDHKHHTITAKIIHLAPDPTGDHATVSGTAIIDLLPPSPAQLAPGSILVRADGYFILLTPRTTLTSSLPDPSLAGIHANTWITYHGIRRPDGVILADKISIRPNVIANKEGTLLAKLITTRLW